MTLCADGVAEDRLTPKDLTLTQPIVVFAGGFWKLNKQTYPRLGIPRQGVFAGRLQSIFKTCSASNLNQPLLKV